ncbi:hypothetical protein IEO21_09769 [Rhodonia placenta]|uniref:Uncharacterized protein n=1 Tax=Rhodonia placenta TaxID=104341 RepID=A0A8H7NTV8_9APHY|nr:hypothetical protein IEO21_09765 [Postia placenta]KAF9802979.1 hypothetical protein IEO21_09769 [Postia placenta]
MQHRFSAQLRQGLSPEMVTVYAKRGSRVAVVVDAWNVEKESHYEWEIVFHPRDVDMASVRVVLEADGELLMTVRRRGYGVGSTACPVIREGLR